MHITLQRDAGAGVSEDFTQRFDLKIDFHTAGRKSMPQRVEADAGKTAGRRILFQMLLHHAGLDIAAGFSCQDESVGVAAPHTIAELYGIIGQRNDSCRGVAFRLADNDLCF